MSSSMFRYDEGMTDLILAACRDRLALDPVPLDYGGLVESLAAVLSGLIGAHGRDAGKNEENGAEHVDEVAQAAEVMRTGQEVLHSLAEPQPIPSRKQDVTPVAAEHSKRAERPAALLLQV